MDNEKVNAALMHLGRVRALLLPLLLLCPDRTQASLLHTIVVAGAQGLTPSQVQQVGTAVAEASLGGASGIASAGFGTLRISASANGLGDRTGSSARDVQLGASFSDSVTING